MTAYLVLAGSAFAAQALLFVPVVPLLLVTGALVSRGELQISWAVVALVAGVGAGDFLWYYLGKHGGTRVLNRVCRLAIEPATCVRRTQNVFGRHGARALLFAKFIPGLSTVALPLSGAFGMRARRFLAFDVIGVLAWTSAYLVVGYISARQIASAPRIFTGTPGRVAGVALAALGIYWLSRYVRRQRIKRQFRTAGISVEELRRKLDAGADTVVVDLRHRMDFERDPYTIPHALYIPAEDLPDRHHEIRRDRDVVLYCTCPDEITSAAWAVKLRSMGVRSARPLNGGFSAWRAAGLPVSLAGKVVPPDEWLLNNDWEPAPEGQAQA